VRRLTTAIPPRGFTREQGYIFIYKHNNAHSKPTIDFKVNPAPHDKAWNMHPPFYGVLLGNSPLLKTITTTRTKLGNEQYYV